MPCPRLHLPSQIRLKPYGAARPFIYFLLLCLSIRGTTLQALYSLVVVVMCSSDKWNRYSGHCRSVSGLRRSSACRHHKQEVCRSPASINLLLVC